MARQLLRLANRAPVLRRLGGAAVAATAVALTLTCLGGASVALVQVRGGGLGSATVLDLLGEVTATPSPSSTTTDPDSHPADAAVIGASPEVPDADEPSDVDASGLGSPIGELVDVDLSAAFGPGDVATVPVRSLSAAGLCSTWPELTPSTEAPHLRVTLTPDGATGTTAQLELTPVEGACFGGQAGVVRLGEVATSGLLTVGAIVFTESRLLLSTDGTTITLTMGPTVTASPAPATLAPATSTPETSTPTTSTPETSTPTASTPTSSDVASPSTGAVSTAVSTAPTPVATDGLT